MFTTPYEEFMKKFKPNAELQQIAEHFETRFNEVQNAFKTITDDMDSLEEQLASEVNKLLPEMVDESLRQHLDICKASTVASRNAVQTAADAANLSQTVYAALQGLENKVSHLDTFRKRYENLAMLTFVACGAAIISFLVLTAEVVYHPFSSTNTLQEPK